MTSVKALLSDLDDFATESHVVTVNGEAVMVNMLFHSDVVGTSYESQVREKEIALAVANHCREKFGAGRLTRKGHRKFTWG